MSCSHLHGGKIKEIFVQQSNRVQPAASDDDAATRPSSANRPSSSSSDAVIKSFCSLLRPYFAYLAWIGLLPGLLTSRRQRRLVTAAAITLNLLAYIEAAAIAAQQIHEARGLDAGAMLSITMIVFNLYCGISQSIFVYLSCVGRFFDFFKLIDAAVASLTGWGPFCDCIERHLARSCRRYRLLFWGCTAGVVVNSVFSAVLILLLPRKNPFEYILRLLEPEETMGPVHQIGWRYVVWRVVISLLLVLKSSMWIYSMLIFLTIAISVASVFSAYEIALDKQLANLAEADPDSSSVSGQQIRACRRHFVSLLDLLETADGLARMYLSVTFVFGLACPILLLYYLIQFPESRQETIFLFIMLFWAGTAFAFLFVPVAVAGYISDLTQRPKQKIQRLTVTQEPHELIQFVNILSSDDNGLTCLSLFVIKKSLVLELAGLFLTYFFLLVQMKSPDGSCCNQPSIATAATGNATTIG